MPERGVDRLGDDPVGAYQSSSASLLAAFSGPGVLERSYRGPLGSATGAERLQIRLYDLLAHGWDLAQAARMCPFTGAFLGGRGCGVKTAFRWAA